MTTKGKTKPKPHTSILLTRANIVCWHLLENCGEWHPSDAFVKPGINWDMWSSRQQQSSTTEQTLLSYKSAKDLYL